MEVIAPVSPSDLAGGVRVLTRVWRKIRARIAPDHLSIAQLYWRQTVYRWPRVYVHVAVAPSRSLRRKMRQLAPAAKEFVHSVMPNTFEADPTLSTREFVLYQVPNDRSQLIECGFYFGDGGVVEFIFQARTIEEGDQLAFQLADLVRAIGIMATATRQRFYRRLVGKRFGIRVDWHINVGSSQEGEVGYREWTQVLFPGRGCEGRSANSRGFTPVLGYGENTLRSKRDSSPPGRIVSVALSDFLEENGFFGCEETIQEAMTGY